MKGILISFEGTEGSGKSTQAKMLCSFLKRKGFSVLHLREPGSTALAEGIRKILLGSKKKIFPICEALLYITCRAQLVGEKILPALKKNIIVVCDRFIDATVAYQGYGLGVDINFINSLNRFATRSITPDVTFFLDVDVKKGLGRCLKIKGFADRIEKRSYDFHKRVRSGYLSLAKRFPDRIRRIQVDNKDEKTTQAIIRSEVLDVIKRYQRAKSGHTDP